MVSHTTQGTKVCRFCKKSLRNIQKLKSHIRSHHSRSEAYECSVCSKKVGNAFALKVQICLHQSNGKKHQCHVCGKRYLTLSKLNKHALKHSEGRLTCAWCNKSFSEKAASKIITRGARKGQVMISSPGRRPIHTSAGIAISNSPGITTQTIILRRVILMSNNLQLDGQFANQTVSCGNWMVKLAIRWIFAAFMCSP